MMYMLHVSYSMNLGYAILFYPDWLCMCYHFITTSIVLIQSITTIYIYGHTTVTLLHLEN